MFNISLYSIICNECIKLKAGNVKFVLYCSFKWTSSNRLKTVNIKSGHSWCRRNYYIHFGVRKHNFISLVHLLMCLIWSIFYITNLSVTHRTFPHQVLQTLLFIFSISMFWSSKVTFLNEQLYILHFQCCNICASSQLGFLFCVLLVVLVISARMFIC